MTAVANHAQASVSISPDAADSATAGHQVSLAEGANTITVVAENKESRNFGVTVNRKNTGHTPIQDFAFESTNSFPRGIWSDNTTMWVAYSDLDDNFPNDKIYAYKMSDKTRDPSKDFEPLEVAMNTELGGTWSNGTNMWVADRQG